MSSDEKKPVVVLEFNEVSFPYIDAYLKKDAHCLPTFRALIAKSGYGCTVGESVYEDIEPWIHWVNAHTGKSLREHEVFRLGDIVEKPQHQIWEALEARGISVGAVSPMNATNACKNPAFFVPDPWTPTACTGSWLTKALYGSICRAVSENAVARVSLKDLFIIVLALARYASPSHYFDYLKHGFHGLRKRWHRVSFLDLLIGDLYLSLWKKSRPKFSTLFLNGAAHVQHHYMYNAQPYAGEIKNPQWYVKPGVDPLLTVYECYDRILKSSLTLGARVIVLTGLSQIPYPSPIYYWRLRDHAAFLQKRGVPFESISPRMSRDFIVQCRDAAQCNDASEKLRALKDKNNVPLFDVDNRGESIFVTLSYPHDIEAGALDGLRDDVVFVALKNGHHSTVGYVLDTGLARHEPNEKPLTSVYQTLMSAAGA